MEEDRREQSEQPLDCVCILYECDCRYYDCDHCFIFFLENKSHGVEPFALILSLHIANHLVMNNREEISGRFIMDMQQQRGVRDIKNDIVFSKFYFRSQICITSIEIWCDNSPKRPPQMSCK
jgi:hypothetical protein